MLSRFFVARPIFAWVLSIVIVQAGLACLITLPIAQYPPIVPPTISVTTSYPGASAVVLGDTVGQPIEAQINGVEGMIYMSSTCTNNGQYTLTVSFKVGTDIHTALMLVQTRVQLAMPQLPESVQKQGVNVQMKSPNILLAVNMYSPDNTRDPLYLSNYAEINIFDELSRLPGVGLVSYLGQRQYSMRAWVDPQKLASLDITANEVVQAIREQNVEVAPGNIGQQPVPKGQDFQIVLSTLGRLTTPAQFGDIIVKVGKDGRFVRLRDVARLDLGSQNSDLDCTLSRKLEDGTIKHYPSVGLAVFQLPQANALDVGEEIKKKMEALKTKFPRGVDYTIAYDTTPFIQHSVDDVFVTIFIAAILVVIVVMVFIQDWRAMLLPIIDIVVSLIGTFVVMKMLGFSLNNLSLFGLVLAVGIVVDDSIVVVENIERWMGMGLPAKEATIKAMDEITGPVIGITLVLASVFIPTAFIPGLSGQFFQQFALTIACSTMISATNALTMAPARAASWIKPHGHGHEETREALPRVAYAALTGGLALYLLAPVIRSMVGAAPAPGAGAKSMLGPMSLHDVKLWSARIVVFAVAAVPGWIVGPACNRILAAFFGVFNRAFDAFAHGYAHVVGWALRLSAIVLVIYVGLVVLTGVGFVTSPTGFIPEQDQGYLLVNVELPDAASVQRTQRTMVQLADIALKNPGVRQTMTVSGYSALFQCDSSNWGTIFVILDDFEERKTPETQAAALIQKLNHQYYTTVLGARAPVFGAPPVPGLGQGGGFQLQILDRTGLGFKALQEVTETVVEKSNEQPGLVNVFTTFKANTPQYYLEIDREMAKTMGVSLNDVFNTLNVNMGSVYVNQFNEFGRIWQVNIQAEGEFRRSIEDIKLLKVRNNQGQAVPLASMVRARDDSGPVFVMRYNNLNSTAINGNTRPGFSSGQAISVIDTLADQNLPQGMSYDWTNLSYQEVTAGNTGIFVFAFAVTLVFLVLAALYESWGLPLAIILVVPMCLLSSITGLVWISHMPIDIFSQIGFVVLVGLAAKNAILIVEYAKEKQAEGMERREATILACRLRLRPILMTSFAFILGVYPMVIATGAGWEMRHSLGTAVFSGMIGVTFFGVFLTPVFYYTITGLSADKGKPPAGEEHKPAEEKVDAAIKPVS
ncbi:MAG: efflux RND transporter permease subunit [Gemmataceae bacterium]|nr:efflux RND transporter permease subunit [Gemmataceae bacterium]